MRAHRQISRFAAWAIICLAVVSPLAAQEADLVIGVRDDAPPFSWRAPAVEGVRDTPNAPSDVPDEVFTGFMVNVCAAVIDAMRYEERFTVRYEPVSAAERFPKLNAGEIDVLCDPATINAERLSQPHIHVSPPVYLSGVGLVESSRRQWFAHWPCIGPIVGIVAGTTAQRAIVLIANQFGFGENFSPIVAAYPTPDEIELSEEDMGRLSRCEEVAEDSEIDLASLASYTNPNPALTDPNAAVTVRSFANHNRLARALCTGQIYYSVGDLEIVGRALEQMRQEMPDCEARIISQPYTEERYGIFAHISPNMDRSDRLALAFLRQLSIEIHSGRNSVLVRSFTDNFDRANISRSLDLFFWSVVAGGE